MVDRSRVAAIAGAAMFGASVAAHAGTVVLNFVGLQDGESILNYYNGGFGGSGSGPGPHDGITFSVNSLASISDTDGGTGNFANAPSSTVAFFLSGGADTMDVPAGFTTGFSFFYASASNQVTGSPGSVQVYSGLDGTGSLLASLTLPDTTDPYNVWAPIGVTFSGTAESVNFGGGANFIGFDNITLGSATAGSAPEPASLALLGAGLLGLGAARWVRRR